MLQIHRIFLARLGLFATSLCLVVLASACAAIPQPAPQPGGGLNAPATPEFTTTEVQPGFDAAPAAAAATPDQDCPGVDSMLLQVTGSSDPIAQAEQLQIKVKDGKIQVVLTLSEPDTSFLSAYGVEIGSQAELRVQAFVPPDQLCQLARSGRIVAINVPNQAVTQ